MVNSKLLLASVDALSGTEHFPSIPDAVLASDEARARFYEQHDAFDLSRDDRRLLASFDRAERRWHELIITKAVSLGLVHSKDYPDAEPPGAADRAAR